MTAACPSTTSVTFFLAASSFRLSVTSSASESSSTFSRGISSPSSSWDSRIMSPISVTMRVASMRIWPIKCGTSSGCTMPFSISSALPRIPCKGVFSS